MRNRKSRSLKKAHVNTPLILNPNLLPIYYNFCLQNGYPPISPSDPDIPSPPHLTEDPLPIPYKSIDLTVVFTNNTLKQYSFPPNDPLNWHTGTLSKTNFGSYETSVISTTTTGFEIFVFYIPSAPSHSCFGCVIACKDKFTTLPNPETEYFIHLPSHIFPDEVSRPSYFYNIIKIPNVSSTNWVENLKCAVTGLDGNTLLYLPVNCIYSVSVNHEGNMLVVDVNPLIVPNSLFLFTSLS